MPTEEDQWVIKLSKEVSKMGDTLLLEAMHWEKRSIYKVPAYVTNLNKKAYKPHAVSFGPYHHGEPHLIPMEEHKQRALIHFLKRSKKPIQQYTESLSDVAEDLKNSYDSLDPSWQTDTYKFVQLMILDGCFLLEVLRFATQIDYDEEDLDRAYASNDPIFSNHGKLHVMSFIKRDMLMLENQLPMLLLQKLLEVEGTELGDDIIKKLILRFLGSNVSPTDKSMEMSLHVLDVYRKSLIWEDPGKTKKKAQQKKLAHKAKKGGDEMIRSAMELNEAGVRLRKSKSRSLKDITFKGGVLKLPRIVVDDATESVFLNLMAFERFHVGVGNEITSYIFFMDNIIDSALDVSLLNSHGIIQNAVGSDKAVAKLFNSLSQDIALDPDSNLDYVHKKVNSYYRKPWNKWRANLMHTYFTNPWAILSVVAAIFLFALTIIQTVYSVLAYY